jgi:hypothetical protein
MATEIRYEGWARYSNTGSAYRRWRFMDEYEPFKAFTGYLLEDPGPRDDGHRFLVRDCENSTVYEPTEDEVRKLLLGNIPPWEPPGEPSEEAMEVIEGVTKLITTMASMATTLAKLAMPNSRSTLLGSTLLGNERKETPYLRLVREGEYGNTGEAFRVWELKVDCPEIRVFHVFGVGGKSYAQAGDELWEEPDDELTPYELKRGGKRIANPEHWLVRRLFENEGVPGETVETPAEGTVQRSALFDPHGDGFRACVVRKPLASIGAEPGDVLLTAQHLNYRPALYGRVTELGLDDYEALRDALPDVEFIKPASDRSQWAQQIRRELEEYICGTRAGRDDLYRIATFLGTRQRWGKRLKVFYSRLLLIKPYGTTVSEPITAAGDEGAIYELLHQVGCRLPEEAD